MVDTSGAVKALSGFHGLSVEVLLRRCPTLPHSVGCSTIGVCGLSFRVRNVSGRFPTTMTTAKMVTRLCCPLPPLGVWVECDSYSGCKQSYFLLPFCGFV